MEALEQHFKFTVNQYNQLANEGLFDNVRTELLDGEIFIMAPMKPKNAGTQRKTLLWLFKASNDLVNITGSVRCGDQDAPEPDVFVIDHQRQYDGDNYPSEHVKLAVEVSDTTFRADTKTGPASKLSKFAKGGIPLVWVINVNTKKAYVYTEPNSEEGEYACMVKTDQLVYEGKTVSVADLVADHG